MVDYLSIPFRGGNRFAAENKGLSLRFPPAGFDYLSIPSLGVASIPSLPPPGGEGGRESKLPGNTARGKSSLQTITSPAGNRSALDGSLSIPSLAPSAQKGLHGLR